MQVKGRKTYRNDHLPIILPIINYMVINSTCSSASWPRPVQWLLGAFDRRSDAQCNQKATKMWSLRASERRRGGRMRNRQSVGRRSKSNCEWNWSRRIDVETDEWLLCRFSFLPFFRLASRSLIGPVVVCIFNSKIISAAWEKYSAQTWTGSSQHHQPRVAHVSTSGLRRLGAAEVYQNKVKDN